MLGLRLVLATLHGWFTISVEQDKQKSVTLNAIFGEVPRANSGTESPPNTMLEGYDTSHCHMHGCSFSHMNGV